MKMTEKRATFLPPYETKGDRVRPPEDEEDPVAEREMERLAKLVLTLRKRFKKDRPARKEPDEAA